MQGITITASPIIWGLFIASQIFILASFASFHTMWMRVNLKLPEKDRLAFYGYRVQLLREHYRSLYPKSRLNEIRVVCQMLGLACVFGLVLALRYLS